MIIIDNIKNLDFKCGVYGIKNKISDKWYFGGSVEIDKRLKRHLWELNKGIHCNDHLQKSWNKHGKSNFEFYLIEECSSKEEIINEEQKWINKYPFEKLYNISPDASHPGNVIWTEERKARNSGKNHHMYGKRHKEKSKYLISKNRKGITAGEKHHLYGIGHTKEAKHKMSESHKLLTGNKNSFYGKNHTEETKRINSRKKKKWLAENGHPMQGSKMSKASKMKQSLAKLSKPPKVGKYKGVNLTKNGKRYIARIRINKKVKSLGIFKDPIEAAKNYDFYAKIIYPSGAYLNFSDYDYTNFIPNKQLDC